MKYNQKIISKNGKEIQIRNATASDGSAVLENFNLTHAETDYLLTYPDENRFDAEQEGRFLERKVESTNEIELIAIVDGQVVGTAGVDAVGNKYKVAHRAEFGISVLKKYWGLGIGRALMEACIQCSWSIKKLTTNNTQRQPPRVIPKHGNMVEMFTALCYYIHSATSRSSQRSR